jgi:TonB dependent receptor-like, beta-barrel
VVTPDMNIPGVYALDASVALRYERFNVGGVDPDVASPTFNQFVTNSFSSTDPKVQVRYQPFKDLTLRGSYSTAFVAPSVFQLFSTAIPYWKGFLDLNYQLGGFQTGIKFNYIADVMDDNTGVIVEPVERRVREWYTFDWRASYLFKKPEEVVADNGFTKEKGGYSKDGKAIPPPPPQFPNQASGRVCWAARSCRLG